MAEVTEEMGKCEECGSEIKLDEAWRVDEKFFCQNCFEKLDM